MVVVHLMWRGWLLCPSFFFSSLFYTKLSFSPLGLHASCTPNSQPSKVNMESSVLDIFLNGSIPNSFIRKIVLLQRLFTKFPSSKTTLPTLLLLWILVPPTIPNNGVPASYKINLSGIDLGSPTHEWLY